MKKKFFPSVGDRRQTGVSLVEVLVTMVVLSLGLLGLAALQALGLKAGESSHYRASAAFFAQDMVNRMRANPFAARAKQYDLALEANPPTGSSMANVEVREWFGAMRRVLPSAYGGIVVNDNKITVTVQWDDRRGARQSAETKSTFVLETDL